MFGCDDCQLVCPWNKFANLTPEEDFQPRHGLADVELLTLFSWTEEEFLSNTEGSAMRRIGHPRWPYWMKSEEMLCSRLMSPELTLTAP